MVFPVVGGDGKPTGYEVENSLRFNRADNPRLSRTPSSAGNRKTFTLSTWIKFCNFTLSSGSQNIYESRPGATSYFLIVLTNTGNASGGNTIRINSSSSIGGATTNIGIDRFFRDPSAWYHLVLAFDTTQGTASNRIKMYVNGEQTGLNSTYTTYPDQNEEFYWNNNNITVVGGSSFSSAEDSDIYLAETYNIDGQQLDSSYFGETNDNGVWIPKKYTGSYGTNGFKLEYKQTGTSQNSSGIGADTSGNDNHFAVTSLAATDVTVDTPTNNFATLNPLQTRTYPTLAEGNLVQTGHSSSDSAGIGATIMPASGKWYAEAKVPNISSASDGYPHFGITDTSLLSTRGTQGTKIAAGFKINDAASVTNTNILGTTTLTNTNWPSWSDDDIINFALDLDNRKLYIGKNGTYINSGDPAAGSNHQITWANSTEISLILAGYSVSSGSGGGGDDTSWNYGNPAFSISSGNADANGYGNFEYAPPSGYYAICTKNLAEYG